jgi:hypothetical protein
MPKKETREAIEAELNATETERLRNRIEEIFHEIEELEATLQQIEEDRGLPSFIRSKPLVERMTNLGMSQEAIDAVGDMLDAMTKAVQGKMDEISGEVRQGLAVVADAEISALDQLQDILDARRRRPRN